jgi:hypothetical protein
MGRDVENRYARARPEVEVAYVFLRVLFRKMGRSIGVAPPVISAFWAGYRGLI